MHRVEVCLNNNNVFNFITIYVPNTYVCQNNFIQESYYTNKKLTQPTALTNIHNHQEKQRDQQN